MVTGWRVGERVQAFALYEDPLPCTVIALMQGPLPRDRGSVTVRVLKRRYHAAA